MSYPIWAILGKQEKKFVLILCQTLGQAKQHMRNLKRELEGNERLKSALGPFKEESDEWGLSSLVFSHLGAKIMVVSIEQSIRGLRHYEHRPDLIIGDDIENIASTRNKEMRDKTYDWLTGEVIPAGSARTRLILIGNLLHEDSTLMRYREKIESEGIPGVFRRYPLIDEVTGQALWPGKYPNETSIEAERQKTGNEIAWQREHLLRIVYDHTQVVLPEWIQYYDELPDREQQRDTIIGIDLAISEKNTADYTAIVSGIMAKTDDTYLFYILPNPINRRMGFSETRSQARSLYDALALNHPKPDLVIEDVGYQKSLIEVLAEDGYDAKGVRVATDKRSRLATVSPLIQSGKILFPKKGAESLIQQIIGFGIEKHDDLVDAFSLASHNFIEESNRPRPGISIIESPIDYTWRNFFSDFRGV